MDWFFKLVIALAVPPFGVRKLRVNRLISQAWQSMLMVMAALVIVFVVFFVLGLEFVEFDQVNSIPQPFLWLTHFQAHPVLAILLVYACFWSMALIAFGLYQWFRGKSFGIKMVNGFGWLLGIVLLVIVIYIDLQLFRLFAEM